MREASGPTTAPKTKLKRIVGYLKGRQRCVLNILWMGKLDGHPCDHGCRLGWRPKDKVLHVWWSIGNRSVLHSSTQATVSLSSAESEAKAITKGCIEALCGKQMLEHQTTRPFKVELWTDSSSSKTIWVQQLNKIGLISLNKFGTVENVADVFTKHVPRTVLDKLAGLMGYTFLFQEYTSIKQN